MKHLYWMSSILVVLTGCAGLPSAVTRLTTPGGTTATSTKSVKIVVNAPSTLATNGTLVSGDASGLVTAGGGNLITAGGGNLITAGGGNFVSADADGMDDIGFHVLDSVSDFTQVQQAVVQIEKLDGTVVGRPFKTDSSGAVSLTGVPTSDPLQAISYFKVGDQTYREATPIAAGNAGGQVYADPINTMVDAAVIKWLGNNPVASQVTSHLLDFGTLQKVWNICNSAGITLKPSDLTFSQGEDQASLVTTLVGKWNDAINAKDANGNYVLSQTDRDAINAFKTLVTGGSSN